MEPLLDLQQTPALQKPFVLWGRFHVSFAIVLVVSSFGVIVGGFGQQVALPLFLSTFTEEELNYTSPYFVLWFCSFCFVVFFGVVSAFLVWRGAVTREMMAWRWHPYMAAVGALDALNGVFVVYASPLDRTPGPLQAILLQAQWMFTLALSYKFLGKVYNKRLAVGVAIVALAVALSLIPVFKRVADGDHDSTMKSKDGWWWPIIFLLGVVPGAGMYVVQEKMQDRFREDADGQKRFSVMWFQFIESAYQLTTITIVFWLDLIPHFGASSDLHSLWQVFDFDWRCFLGEASAVAIIPRCHSLCGGLGVLFIASYICSYVFGTWMTQYASANLQSLAGTAPPVLALLFWYAFPTINAWADGEPYPLKSLDFVMNMISAALIIAGIVVYRLSEPENKAPQRDECADGAVELCF